jgi:sugar phosphate isomerase/epimerase
VIDPDRLSLQLYTLRVDLDRDPEGTIARIAEIGFRQVEPFGLVERGPALAGLLEGHGLTAPTSHESLIGADLGPVFDAAEALGVRTVIDPYVDPERWQTADEVSRIAGQLNEIASRAAERGLAIGYHNHHFELASMIDGRHALELFAERLDPAVQLEVDTYWAAAGGADVPALLERLGDRVTALHVKDGDRSLDPLAQVAVGAGTMPIADILAVAPGRLAVVELDDFAGEMFDAVSDDSYAYLQAA